MFRSAGHDPLMGGEFLRIDRPASYGEHMDAHGDSDKKENRQEPEHAPHKPGGHGQGQPQKNEASGFGGAAQALAQGVDAKIGPGDTIPVEPPVQYGAGLDEEAPRHNEKNRCGQNGHHDSDDPRCGEENPQESQKNSLRSPPLLFPFLFQIPAHKLISR